MDTPDPKPRKGLALGSAAVGAVAILGSLLAFSGGAGAQDAPELSEPAAETTVAVDDADGIAVDALELDPELEAAFAAYDSCLEDQLGVTFETADENDLVAITDDAWAAADEACGDLLPEDLFLDAGFVDLDDGEIMMDDFFIDPATEAEWAAYDECVQNELGIDFETADDAAWENLGEDAWAAADDACQDELPQEIQDMNAAWKNYDDCLAENGISFDEEIDAVEDLGASVFIEDGDAFTMAEFGEADGTITITQSNGEITVVGDGDVEILDDAFGVELDEEWEAAHAACEGELPEDAFFDEIMPLEGDELFELEDDAIEVPAEA